MPQWPYPSTAGHRRVDSDVERLLTSASRLMAQLPGRVLARQRADLVQALSQAHDLVIEVHTRPAVILVRDGERALVKIPANAATG
jgi:hypothetical protein